jgi:hypothetical protein
MCAPPEGLESDEETLTGALAEVAESEFSAW